MANHFLSWYSRELSALRARASKFADKHPKIAGRLGMNGLEVADPYVERLLEGVAFMAARVQVKLNAEFPRFTQRLYSDDEGLRARDMPIDDLAREALDAKNSSPRRVFRS